MVEGARDEHPNELAHRIAAQALLAALESLPLKAPKESAGSAARIH